MIISHMAELGYKEGDIVAAINAVGINLDKVLDHLLANALPTQAQPAIDKEKIFIDEMASNGLDRKMVEMAVKEVGMDPNNVQMYIAQKMSENDMIEKVKEKSLYGSGGDNEDFQLQQAIEASLATQNPSSSSSGSFGRQDKERVPGMPVGLFNTGAICYFNTFVQTYFAIPPIRKFFIEMEDDLIEAITLEMKDDSDHFKTEDVTKSTVEFKDLTDKDKEYLLFECNNKLFIIYIHIYHYY